MEEKPCGGEPVVAMTGRRQLTAATNLDDEDSTSRREDSTMRREDLPHHANLDGNALEDDDDGDDT